MLRQISQMCVVLALFVVQASSAGGADPVPQKPSGSEPVVESLFARLTKNTWVFKVTTSRDDKDDKYDWVDVEETFTFRRNGTYTWTYKRNYETRDAGQWSMLPNAKATAAIHLGGKADVAVTIKDGQLVFAGRPFAPGKEIEYDADEAKLEDHQLKVVEPTATWKRLVSTPWKKANDFHLNRNPDQLTFKEDGQYVASYRRGECSHGGTWSVLGPPGNRKEKLLTHPEPHMGDVGSSGAAPVGSGEREIQWFTDVLFVWDAYYPEDKQTDKRVFIWQPDTRLRVSGEYEGPLVQGTAKPIRLTYTALGNSGDRDFSLVSLRVVLLKLKGTQADGEEAVLLDKRYTNVTLALRHASNEAHGGIYTDQIELTPSVHGEYCCLRLILQLKDDCQEYPCQTGYMLRIGEK